MSYRCNAEPQANPELYDLPRLHGINERGMRLTSIVTHGMELARTNWQEWQSLSATLTFEQLLVEKERGINIQSLKMIEKGPRANQNPFSIYTDLGS